MLLGFGAPHKPLLLVGREHGRTIPLADSKRLRHSPKAEVRVRKRQADFRRDRQIDIGFEPASTTLA
jgi:hypothetical protein